MKQKQEKARDNASYSPQLRCECCLFQRWIRELYRIEAQPSKLDVTQEAKSHKYLKYPGALLLRAYLY